jgi:hypothetical protein
MAIRDLLERSDLFRFEFDALTDVEQYFVGPSETERVGAELTSVSAAEVAATRSLLVDLKWVEGDLEKPIPVTRFDAQFALVKAICTPFWPCKPEPDQPRRDKPEHLWDVVLFSGDMAKLASLGITDVRALADDPVRIAEQLEERYRESSVDWAPQVAESGHVRLEVFLWVTKLALIRNPDEAELEAEGYARALGFNEPIDA